jgi:hypothetical protein
VGAGAEIGAEKVRIGHLDVSGTWGWVAGIGAGGRGSGAGVAWRGRSEREAGGAVSAERRPCGGMSAADLPGLGVGSRGVGGAWAARRGQRPTPPALRTRSPGAGRRGSADGPAPRDRRGKVAAGVRQQGRDQVTAGAHAARRSGCRGGRPSARGRVAPRSGLARRSGGGAVVAGWLWGTRAPGSSQMPARSAATQPPTGSCRGEHGGGAGGAERHFKQSGGGVWAGRERVPTRGGTHSRGGLPSGGMGRTSAQRGQAAAHDVCWRGRRQSGECGLGSAEGIAEGGGCLGAGAGVGTCRGTGAAGGGASRCWAACDGDGVVQLVWRDGVPALDWTSAGVLRTPVPLR